MLRIHSVLSDEVERLVHRIIGSGLTVHRELGPGFLEAVYQRSLYLELQAQGLQFEREHVVQVSYRSEVVAVHRIDLIVERAVIVEVKASRRIDPVHEAQVISYLKATGLRVGLLMNFNAAVFRGGIRRIVL